MLGSAAALAAQALPQEREPLRAFEVASVKPNTSGDDVVSISSPPGRFYVINMPLRHILSYAFDVVQTADLLRDVPAWTDNARYDINAKLPAGAPRAAMIPMLRAAARGSLQPQNARRSP